MKYNKAQQGYTLIELLVVVSLVVTVGGLSYFLYAGHGAGLLAEYTSTWTPFEKFVGACLFLMTWNSFGGTDIKVVSANNNRKGEK